MRCLARRAGGSFSSMPRISSTIDHPTVDSLATASMTWTRALSLRSQRLRQQLVDIKYLDIVVAQHLDKGVVLFLGPLHPEDVIKEQLVVVRGGKPAQAQIGSVDYDLSQLSDL